MPNDKSTEDKSKNPVLLNTSLIWNSFGLNFNKAVRNLRFCVDEENNLWGFPTIVMSGSSGGMANVSTVSGDLASEVSLSTQTNNFIYNNATGLFGTAGTWEKQRTPTIFVFTNANNAGSTALWTPAAGKKFRLMGYNWTVGSNTTAAVQTVVQLMDNATGISVLFTMGATTSGVSNTTNFNGNGYLSVAANNVLNINLSNAMTAGQIYVTAWGCEE